jgi:membrane protein implicated in regulation of membrane protease activity
MTFVPVMWAIWGVLVISLAALYVYRSSLTRDEDDQVILDDSFDNVKNEQAVIVEKVKKIEPLVRVCLWLVGAMTLFVIAYYIRDIFLQLSL